MHSLRAGALLAPLFAVFASDSVLAQVQTVVSPVGAATVDGATNNSFPWASGTVRRYLQVHSDIKGSVKIVNKLAWRRDGSYATTTSVRMVDLELFMGESVEWDQAQFVISNNYVGPRTQVLTRQIVNLGPLPAAGSPAPFEIAIPLGSTFLYVGVKPIAWEAVVYSNTGGSFPQIDAEVTTQATTPNPLAVGTGCIAGGMTAAMSLAGSHCDSAGLYHFGTYVLNAPASQPVYLAFGSSNPNLTVPGLCGPLYTDLVVVLPVGTSTASGMLANISETSTTTRYAAPSMIFAAPNTFAGANIYLQAHAVDPLSTSPLPIANSNGLVLTVPTPNTSRKAQVTRIFNNGSGTAATQGIYFNTSSIGHGLVTEFTY